MLNEIILYGINTADRCFENTNPIPRKITIPRSERRRTGDSCVSTTTNMTNRATKNAIAAYLAILEQLKFDFDFDIQMDKKFPLYFT